MHFEIMQERRGRSRRTLGLGAGLGLGLAVLFGSLWGGDAQAFSPAEVYRNASGSVVLIFGFDDAGRGSSGTGSIISRDGLVLTNNHVIANAETEDLFPNLVVYFKPNPISGDNRKDLAEPYLVDVVARDAKLDLALLRVKEPPSGLRPIEVGNSEEVDIGEPVAAIGHPGGGGLWTLTTGTVSSKRRDQARDIFQTDTAINPGNSGGPLLDEHARLVGVNTFVRRVNDQGLPLEGLNYSLRSRLALDWVNRQGVTRVAAISRSAADSAPAQPAPRAEPVPEPAPSRPEPSAPPPSGERAERESQREPTPPVVRSEPERRREEPPPPSRDEEPREFEGPDGETMYGVPNPEVDLDEALLYAREGFQKLMERADESVQEMDRLFDDYEDF
ncbi:MAG: S1C family serine protease [bacterium]